MLYVLPCTMTRAATEYNAITFEIIFITDKHIENIFKEKKNI